MSTTKSPNKCGLLSVLLFVIYGHSSVANSANQYLRQSQDHVMDAVWPALSDSITCSGRQPQVPTQHDYTASQAAINVDWCTHIHSGFTQVKHADAVHDQ